MEAHGDSSLPDNPCSTQIVHRIAGGALILFTALLMLALAQQFYGIGLFDTLKVAPSKHIYQDGKSWTWRLPPRYQAPLIDKTAVLIEDGVPFLNRAKSNQVVRDNGGGWYRITSGRVRFAPEDDSDPRKNGRLYEVKVPKQLRPWILWLLGGLFTLSALVFHITRKGQGEFSRWQTRVSVPAVLGVFATVLLLLSVGMEVSTPVTDGAVCLKNVPLSDASGWHQMARGLVEGSGFDADFQESRPLHPVLMAPVYALTGSSLKAVRFANVFMLAVTITGVWLFGFCLRSGWTAVFAAATVALLPDHTALTHMVMTENSGMVLAVLSAISLLFAVWHLSPRWSFASGLINGFSGLACGFTLLTLPLYAFVVLLNPILRRAPWQRAILMSIVFTLGVATVLLPWMVRQKVVNQRFTLTFTTPDLLFGGANVDDGGFGSQAFRDAASKGQLLKTPLQRYDYFMAEFKKLVAADPGAYAKGVIKSAFRSFGLMRILEPSTVTLGILLLVILSAAGVWSGSGPARLLAGCLVLATWLSIRPETMLPVFLASWVLTLRRARWPEERLALVILGLTVIGVALLDGLGGNTAPRRFWLTGNWALILILMLALVRATEAVEGIFDSVFQRIYKLRFLQSRAPRSGMSRQFENVAPWVKIATISTITYTSCAFGLILGYTAMGKQKPWPGVGQIQIQGAIEHAMTSHPRIKEMREKGKIFGYLARLDDLIIPVRKGEDLGHWLPGFGKRDVARTIVTLSALGPDGERIGDDEATITGSMEYVPRSQPFLLIAVDYTGKNGISGELEPVTEALGVIPLHQSASGEWSADPERVIWFEVSTEAAGALGM